MPVSQAFECIKDDHASQKPALADLALLLAAVNKRG